MRFVRNRKRGSSNPDGFSTNRDPNGFHNAHGLRRSDSSQAVGIFLLPDSASESIRFPAIIQRVQAVDRRAGEEVV